MPDRQTRGLRFCAYARHFAASAFRTRTMLPVANCPAYRLALARSSVCRASSSAHVAPSLGEPLFQVNGDS